MRRDTQHLELHGNQWRVAIKVPPRLRPILGKTKLKKALGTDSLAVANRDKGAVVTAFRKELERAEAQLRQRAGRQADPLLEEALVWREELANDADDGNVFHALGHREQELERTHGESRAAEFVSIAQGTVTPLTALVEDWLTERSMKPRQVLDYRRAVAKLHTWD